MMSHLWIWERVAHLQDAYALIIEDDVALDRPERLIEEELPRDFDLVFCGDQTALRKPSDAPNEALGCMPAMQALSVIEQDNMCVGAYGYLLSPAGAQRLLALFTTHLYFGHVDVRMMAYCCDLDEVNRLEYLGGVAQDLRAIRRLIGGGQRLAGYATKSPLALHCGMESRRAREDVYGSTGATP
jgi:GR25 family glycosyltransferase involved in LPS biosynthesis